MKDDKQSNNIVAVFENRNSIVESFNGDQIDSEQFDNNLLVRLKAATNCYLCENNGTRYWSDDGSFTVFVVLNLEKLDDGEVLFDLGTVAFRNDLWD